MLVIGSRAMQYHGILQEGRVPNDWDFICTFKEFQDWCKENKGNIRHCVPLAEDKFHVIDSAGVNYEFEIAWPGSSGEDLLKMLNAYQMDIAPLAVLLALKLSHRYLKDSPHFLKTMRDIQYLQSLGVDIGSLGGEWMKKREKETYVYNHPKLNVTKEGFFKGDGVQYVYDHDEIHRIVAVEETPAYTKYIQDGEQVMTSKEKFWSVDQRTRLLGGLEESMVLALERSQVPYGIGKEGGPTDRWSFEMALMKVCTSVTSGYFREFCWEHHNEIMTIYDEMGESWYTDKFKEAVANGEIVPRDL